MRRMAVRLPGALVLTGVLAAAGCGQVNLNGAPSGGSPPPRAAGIVVAVGHGWTSTGLSGPVPAPGSCHLRTAADGEPLPDPACTPGAVDSAVTDANVSSTVCRKGGYTSSVRPPESMTEKVKKQLLAAYGIPLSQISHYELDHLIELAAGGASDVRNLWPEPNTFLQYHQSGFVHNDKDAVEAYTYDAICGGKVAISAVQNAMARDWSTAVASLGLAPVPASY